MKINLKIPRLGSAKESSEDVSEDDVGFVSDEDGPADDESTNEGLDDDSGDAQTPRADRRKLPLAVWIGAGIAVLLVVAGGVYWLIGSDGSSEIAADNGIPRVEVLLPPKLAEPSAEPAAERSAAAKSAFTPPSSTIGQTPSGTIEVAVLSGDAFQHVPLAAKDEPLTVAPDPGLVEETIVGILPRVGADGRRPWQVYAKKVNVAADLPKIALIVDGLGMNRLVTEAAIHRLPGRVTLAFDPYAENLDEWIAEARRAGHETLISMPLESLEFPARDAGPLAISASLSKKENERRVLSVLSRHPGQIGVIATQGSNIAPFDERVRPVLETLLKRGLMVVDATRTEESLISRIATEIGLPRAFVDRAINAPVSQQNVDAELDMIEKEARKKASVVMLARAYPVSVGRLAQWVVALNSKNLALVPVSAIADKQFLP